MSRVFSSLIDALKDAETWLLVATCSAGFVAWRISWAVEWFSSIGLLVFIFCGFGLLWRLFDWVKGHVKKFRRDRSMEIGRVHKEAYRLLHQLRLEAGARGFVQNISISGQLKSLYLRLKALGVDTPNAPPSQGKWESRMHLEYLEAIMPFLNTSQIGAAGTTATAYLKTST